MSQQDALDLLKKTKKWMSVKEINRSLKLRHSSTGINLKKLFRDGFVYRKIRKTKKGNIMYVYRYKYIIGLKKPIKNTKYFITRDL